MSAARWTLIAALLVSSPALAQRDIGTELSTMNLQLSTLQSTINRMALQIEDLTKSLNEMKDCNALARQPPASLAELRKSFSPANASESAKVNEIYTSAMLARAKCGLPLK